MRRLHSIVLLFAVSGCANAAAVYTEGGLRAGAEAWDGVYKAKAAECSSQFEPNTPDMEGCFGAHYDADAKVGIVIESAVAALRTYWTARAAGKNPDIKVLAQRLREIFEDLPLEAREMFDRVRGLK